MNILLKNPMRQGNEKTERIKKTAGLILLFISVWILTKAAISRNTYTPYVPKEPAAILLYGEVPGVEAFYEKEYELWEEHYTAEGLRDLFLELPYYDAQWLNLWMKSGEDAILQQWYDDMEGERAHVEPILDFFRAVRENCPETVFHGTDIGLRYETSGSRYLNYLEEMGQAGSEQYRLAQECIDQGKTYEEKKDAVWREEALTQNFIRAYDASGSEKVVGIYGDAHCDPRRKAGKNEKGCMARQLQDAYGDVISYEAIESMVKIESDKMLEKQPSGKK